MKTPICSLDKAKRDHLLAQVANQKSITSSEEHWLDNDANLIDKGLILDALEKALDYKMGIATSEN